MFFEFCLLLSPLKADQSEKAAALFPSQPDHIADSFPGYAAAFPAVQALPLTDHLHRIADALSSLSDPALPDEKQTWYSVSVICTATEEAWNRLL